MALRRWAAPAVAAILLAVRVRRLFDPHLIVDDAFISFRYADNLARGLGLVYNPGERVEGYSNFLWTVLLAAGARFGIDIVQLSILLALLAALAAVALLWVWSASLFEERPATPDDAVTPGHGSTPAGHAAPGGTRIAGLAVLAALPPLLYAATGSQARYVVSGMETLLFGLLVAAAAWLLVMRDAPLAAGCTFALAAMTRPEGAMYWLVAAGIALLPAAGGARARQAPPPRDASPPPKHPRRRRVLLLVAGFAAPFGTYFAWRWLYYGYPLPNTFYAKAAGFSWTRLARGRQSLAEVASWWSIYPVVLAAAAALPSLLSPKTPEAARRAESLRLAAAYVAVTALYFVYVGGDFLLFFGPRFLMPALPFALLLAAEGLRNLAGWASRRPAGAGGGRRRWQLAVTSAGALLLAGNALWLSWPSRYFDAPGLARLMESWEDLGRWIGATTPPDTVIADGGAGIVPYYSRRANIDMYGLADLHIGHMAPLPVGFKITAHEKYDPRYVLARRPDLLVTSLGRDRTPHTAGLARVKDWVWACYRPWALLRAFPGPDGAWVLPSREFTGALSDEGYWTAVLERRHGRAASGCAAYERAMGVPPATPTPAPSGR
jgi:arabinofuranosyltransferase